VKYIIDFSKVTPIAQMQGKDEEETNGLRTLYQRAKEYLEEFEWCKEIIESYFGFGIAGVVGVFLFKVIPDKPGIDKWLWVVIGDLPPAYLVSDDAPNPVSALEVYIEEMKRWVITVEDGSSIDDVIPVNAPPTTEYAKMLKSRLKFIEKEILSN
jgi:hypothetical protein